MEKWWYLRRLFVNVGLHSANFQISNLDSDNDVLAAMLRNLANRINSGDTPESAARAHAFINAVENDLATRLKA